MAFLETRGTLARLLATENLIVEHDNTVTTASFNTDTRVLKLPVLETESEFVYNMFVGHEVGHALHTPTYWKDDIPDDVPFDFVNVVEDVRIEKHIQAKFPGLRRDFTKSYDELNDKDFFEIHDKDISKFSLIDRINLHFKLGSRALVPFTTEELVYVNAVDECETWLQVVQVSSMLNDYIGDLPLDPKPENQGDSGDNEDIQEQQQPPKSQSNSSGDQENEIENDSTGSSSEESVDQEVSKTQRAFDASMSELADTHVRNQTSYVNVNNVDSRKHMVSVNELRESFVYPEMTDFTDIIRSKYKKFLRDIKSDVNHLVQQFEMKKSADAYSRQQINKTGVLDTNLLHTYKISDDIFLRHNVIPDGKNHGMVMYLDWSGSMQNICLETVKQIITLVQFCRKAHLPFEVYTFTSGGRNHDIDNVSLDMTPAHTTVGLVQVLSSTAKKIAIDTDMFHFFASGYGHAINSGLGRGPYSPHLCMGGTPLNNALMLVPDIISRFRKNTGAQKVSFVCVTDGESSPLIWHKKYDTSTGPIIRESYAYYETVMLRSGSKVFPIGNEDRGTPDMVRWLKSTLEDVSISHLYLAGISGSQRYVYNLSDYKQVLNDKMFRKEGCVTINTDSWPLVGLINPKSLNTETEDMEVQENASKAQIKSALKKYLKSKSSSRLVLNQLVSQFS